MTKIKPPPFGYVVRTRRREAGDVAHEIIPYGGWEVFWVSPRSGAQRRAGGRRTDRGLAGKPPGKGAGLHKYPPLPQGESASSLPD